LVRVHLDTDLGGDTDDACALAMLLGWPGVELVGITTTADPGGRRAGYVAHCLRLAGRDDIPVAAGAEVSLTTRRSAGLVTDERYWPIVVPPRPSPPGAALDLLDRSIQQGATVVAIGSYTNLALLEVARPGRFGRVPVVAMGGWTGPPADGLPAWGPETDHNVQFDTWAAQILTATATRLTLVTLPVTLKAHLRAADLPRLRASGPLGELLARQGEAHGEDHGMAELGRAHAGLPDDLLNFQYDPVACAVAVGWNGATIQEQRLRPATDGEVLRFQPDQDGRLVRVVVDLDGASFTDAWLAAVEAAQQDNR
jgi:inosine-uridine nucleoside N-ribohydrolase